MSSRARSLCADGCAELRQQTRSLQRSVQVLVELREHGRCQLQQLAEWC